MRLTGTPGIGPGWGATFRQLAAFDKAAPSGRAPPEPGIGVDLLSSGTNGRDGSTCAAGALLKRVCSSPPCRRDARVLALRLRAIHNRDHEVSQFEFLTKSTKSVTAAASFSARCIWSARECPFLAKASTRASTSAQSSETLAWGESPG